MLLETASPCQRRRLGLPASAQQNHPRRGAVRPHQAKRQTDELVRSRLDLAEVEALDGDDTRGEERPVSVGVSDRKVVQRHELDSPPDQEARAVARQAAEVAGEVAARPEL